MKKAKLLQIADMLDKFKPTKKLRFNIKRYIAKDECGTICCAFGLAHIRGILPKTVVFKELWDGKFIPYYNGSDRDWALKEYFKIPMKDIDYLFMPASYGDKATPKQVAKRIRKFVKDNAK